MEYRKRFFLLNLLKAFENSDNWVDIEYYYYKKLIHFYNRIERVGFENYEQTIIKLKEFNEGFEFIKEKLIE